MEYPGQIIVNVKWNSPYKGTLHNSFLVMIWWKITPKGENHCQVDLDLGGGVVACIGVQPETDLEVEPKKGEKGGDGGWGFESSKLTRWFLIFLLMQDVYGISAQWDVVFFCFFCSPKIAERLLFE